MKVIVRSLVQSRIDSFGAFISLMCVVHCTLLPALAVTLPFLTVDSFFSESVHEKILIGTIIIALVSCHWGFRRHKKLSPVALMAVGISIIVASFFIQATYHERAAAIGGLLLAIGHITNHLFCRMCDQCQKEK